MEKEGQEITERCEKRKNLLSCFIFTGNSHDHLSLVKLPENNQQTILKDKGAASPKES